MARSERPFLFCRYEIYFGEEKLRPNSHFTVLQELQGQKVPHGRRVAEEDPATTMLMRPRQYKVDGYNVLTWSAGYETDTTLRARYDIRKDNIAIRAIKSDGVRYADFVAIPSLGVLAVDDRINDILIGGKAAIGRMKSILRAKDEGEIQIVFEATPDEVRKALERWSLTKFRFTIRPNNPRPVSRLAEALSDQMKRDKIGVLTATAKPPESGKMHMSDDGLIRAASDLIDAGYGQSAISGYTEDGLQAEIKQPRFSEDRAKNERAQERPRELRVYIDSDGLSEEETLMTVARSLIKFHT